MKNIIIDYRADEEIILKLSGMGYGIIKTKPCGGISEPLKGHPDMVLFFVDDNTVIAEPDSFKHYRMVLTPLGITVISGKSKLDCNYPKDIAYNVARVKNNAFHNTRYTDPVIKEELQKRNIKLIHINQGYSKCSICIVGDSIITSDPGIKKQAEAHNINVLFIKPGQVELKGMEYGFIGGASGEISGKTVAFTGNIEEHSDFLKIKDFIVKQGYKYICLGKNKLSDLGSIYLIES